MKCITNCDEEKLEWQEKAGVRAMLIYLRRQNWNAVYAGVSYPDTSKSALCSRFHEEAC